MRSLDLQARGKTFACLALLALTAAFLFLTGAPTGGAFSWPDSPRHALNGALILDLMRDLPLDDPVGYAYDYYAQYPALTLLLYPPFLHFVLALFYAVLGVSQEAAICALFAFYVALGWGTYFLARLWLPPLLSMGAALLLIAAPAVAFWGRQVMLEIPAYALITWSAYCLVRYTREQQPPHLYLAMFLMVTALYTKLSVAFMAVVFLSHLMIVQGTDLFRKRHHYIALCLAVICCLPLAYITLRFGQANVQSVAGLPDAKVSRISLEGWIWYARSLPGQIGWPVVIGAAAYLAAWMSRFSRPANERKDTVFLLLWFAVGYIFFSSIDLKEVRHSIFILTPLAIGAALAIKEISGPRHRLAGACVTILGLWSLVDTWQNRPVSYVDGYLDVVKYVSSVAPENSNILFSGYRDGSFIFDMRAYADRPDLGVVRADKLLLKMAIRRTLGVEQQSYSEAEIGQLINAVAAHYVVAQPDFWADLDQMGKLQRVLDGEQFQEVRRFDLQSNYNSQERELVVYRNLGDVAQGPVRLSFDLPIIEKTIEGKTRSAVDPSN